MAIKNSSWRLLDTGFADCYTNMAVDEALFLGFAAGHTPSTLRIYGWKPAAFSFGCSQNPIKEFRLDRCQKEGLFFVRRMTGGSIIYHNEELTYSLICHIDELKADISIKESYKISCAFLITTYKRLGICPDFSGVETPQHRDRGFCFSSREKYDIMVNGKKLGGNAQRRKKNIIFQHGSIPMRLDLTKSFYFLKRPPVDTKDDALSLEEALGRRIEFAELKDIVKKSFEQTFSLELREDDLSWPEKELAESLRIEKYQTEGWNFFRNANDIAKARMA